MADIQYYERAIKSKEPKRKALMIGIYAIVLSAWFVICVRFSISAEIVMLIPLSILATVALTWKYTSVEYEYSFTAGIFTFSKIYGKSKRKTVFSGDLKALTLAKPYDAQRDVNLKYDELINAIPKSGANNICLCIFDIDERKTCVLIEYDQLTAKILYHFNHTATSRELLK
ncbi:MAG: hypothetical protein J6U86_06560 [Clostridia bacterium]|nr:hypothetical protein [Clostridia bacterium]